MTTTMTTLRADQQLEQRYGSENGLQRIANLVPRGIDGARMVQSFLSHIRGSAKLMSCTPESLGDALLDCCRWGLFPGPDDHVSIIPRKQQAVAQLTYKGRMCQVYRDTEVEFIKAVIFYDEEVDAGRFKVLEGLKQDLHHEPLPQSQRGQAAGCYAIATFKSGKVVFALMWKDEIEKIRDSCSGGGKFGKGKATGPWYEWPEEMWKKTTIIRLCKNLLGGKTEQVQGVEPSPSQTITALPRYTEGGLMGGRMYSAQTITPDGEVVE